MSDKLQISKSIAFDRVNRLDNKQNSPVITRCTFFNDKALILNNATNRKELTFTLGKTFLGK